MRDRHRMREARDIGGAAERWSQGIETPGSVRRRPGASLWASQFLLIILVVLGGGRIFAARPIQAQEGASLRQETLDFAHKLLRDRRYDLAAAEYRSYLETSPVGEPRAAEARYGLATSLLFLGRYAEAKDAFERFLKDAPEHPNAATARFRVGETAYMLGDMPAAREALERYTAEEKGHHHLATAWPYLGDVCLRMGDLPAARRAYEQAVEGSPEGPLADRARYGLSRTLAAQGEGEASAKVLEQLIEKAGNDWKDKALLQLGVIRLEAGQNEAAAAAFARIESELRGSPLVDEAQLRRGEALERLGKFDEAIAGLEPLAKGEGSQAARAAYLLAAAQLGQNQGAEALATCDAALERFGETAIAPLLLFRSAEALTAMGRDEDAEARYRRIVSEHATDAWGDDAALRAAELALKAGRPAAAAELAESFDERFKDSPLAPNMRLIAGQAALAERQPDEAIKWLEPLLADSKASAAVLEAARLSLGFAYRSKGMPERAAEVLKAVVSEAGSAASADAQYVIGIGHFEAGRYVDAVAAIETYLAARPKGDVAADALAMLAISRQELGDEEGSATALERLAREFPESGTLPAARLRLGEEAFEAKDYDRAAELLRAVAEQPGAEPASRARARWGLGWALLEQGQGAAAAIEFGAVLTDSPEDKHAADSALALGRAWESAGETEKALEAYENVGRNHADSEQAPRALLASARLVERLGKSAQEEQGQEEAARARFAQAGELYGKYLSKVTASAGGGSTPIEPIDSVLADQGWVWLDAGRREEGEQVFARLLSEYPQSIRAADARVVLAETAHQQGDRAKLEELLSPVVAEGGKADASLVQSALFRLALGRFDAGDWKNSRQALDRLVDEFPDGPLRTKARFWQAETAFQSGDLPKAEGEFRALIDQSQTNEKAGEAAPDWLSTARLRLVQSLLGQERWEDLLSEAEKLRASAPEFPSMHELDYSRGRALQGLARFDESRAAYQAVIDARKADDFAARAQFMRGETFFHQEKYSEALREFLRVDYQYPDQPSWRAAALLEAGKVAERMERWSDAVDFYEKLTRDFPDDEHVAQAKERLDQAVRQLGGRQRGPRS